MTIVRPVAALMHRLIDYAGLFPPAGLTMIEAVRRYGEYSHGAYADFLGRFIVPSSRLGELEAAVDGEAVRGRWPLSVLPEAATTEVAALLREFAERHADRFLIESLEIKVADEAHVSASATHLLPIGEVFAEIDPSSIDHLAPHLSAAGLRAKIRTGGVVASAFPDSRSVISFIARCVQLDLPFKATAGLHHPIRCVRPLTYELGSPTGTMHGFVNLYLATALILGGGSSEEALRLLNDDDATHFSIDDDAIRWIDHAFPLAEIETMRTIARSFGSCSFDEPVDDLMELGWISGTATKG